MKIFISHSSHDKWVARQISKILENEKHVTFLDEKNINTGDSIDAEIQKHLGDCDHLLILLSPASISSHWVFIEVGGARALGKKIIPILFHVGINEIPNAIAYLLARDINDLDKYFDEIKPSVLSNKIKKPAPIIISKKSIGNFSVGDLIQIAVVEHLTDEDKALDPRWVPRMDKFSGMKTRITEFSPGGNAKLEIDEGKLLWNFSWITKVE